MQDAAPETTPESTPTPDYRNVTVPIPTEAIKEYFTNKNVFYLANHTQSRLKGSNFLTYLSNLNIPSDIVFDLPLSQEDYFTIMEAYMKQRMVASCQRLNLMMAQLLLWLKGIPYAEIPYDTQVPEAMLEAFAVANKDSLEKWMHFVDSSMVFATAAIAAFNTAHAPKETFPVIDDKEYVGHNVVRLYEVPFFMELYFSLPDNLVNYCYSYFTHQFEDYMFSNQRLAHYFEHNNNFIAHIYGGMASGQIDPNNVDAFLSVKGNDDGAGSAVPASENG